MALTKENGEHTLCHGRKFTGTLTFNEIPAGTYLLEWIEPSTGVVKNLEKLSWAGGNLTRKLHRITWMLPCGCEKKMR